MLDDLIETHQGKPLETAGQRLQRTEFGFTTIIGNSLSVFTGKRLLWRTLDVVLGSGGGSSGFDFAGLEKRAADQFGRVEAQTIEIARQIFTAESG